MSDFGFEKIRYQGKELNIEVDDSTSIAYYEHIYRATFGNDKYRKHMCLQWGSWCWQQARENPVEAIRYLLGRLAK